ncbi:MAG: hydratase, partial [Cloacibacillus sp.]
MIRLIENGAYLLHGNVLVEDIERQSLAEIDAKVSEAGFTPLGLLPDDKKKAARGTISAGIIADHNSSGTEEDYKIRFDSLASHDITYVGIIQTAIASGMKKFP